MVLGLENVPPNRDVSQLVEQECQHDCQVTLDCAGWCWQGEGAAVVTLAGAHGLNGRGEQ